MMDDLWRDVHFGLRSQDSGGRYHYHSAYRGGNRREYRSLLGDQHRSFEAAHASESTGARRVEEYEPAGLVSWRKHSQVQPLAWADQLARDVPGEVRELLFFPAPEQGSGGSK
jgi:hypothetical protein